MIKRLFQIVFIAWVIVMGICHVNDNFDIGSILINKSFAASEVFEYHNKSVDVLDIQSEYYVSK